MWLYRISHALLAVCIAAAGPVSAEETCEPPDIPDAPPASAQLVIRADPMLLPIGVRCRIALPAKPTGLWTSSSTSYEGEIVERAADKLLIRATALTARSDSRPRLSLGLPFVDRHFRSTGVMTQPLQEKEVWLRVAEIESIEVLELPARKGEPAAEPGI